eukprot:m.339465 g.339465  ORF g.339465 m.339465 type:complete len:61 (-) comp20584_c0_seq1:969-1151(-)
MQLCPSSWVTCVRVCVATQAVRQAGIWEMYNPINGSGMGVEGLGMSTLIVDWLYRHGLVR